MRSGSWRVVLPLVLLLGAWVFCGLCSLLSPEQLAGDRGLKPSPDWSRGLRIGEMYGTDGPSLVVDERDHVHLLWIVRLGRKEYDLRYVRLDEQGALEEDRELNAGLFYPRRARLVLREDGSMHAFVLALSEPGTPAGLFHLSLTAEGRLDSEPTLLSAADKATFFYDLACSPQGAIHVFWVEEGDSSFDLFHSTLGADKQARLILHGASHPAVATDSGGNMHLLWTQEGQN
ncbi:MAG: hypothetical protein WBB22_05890, partial [Anaerolineae bacterium]